MYSTYHIRVSGPASFLESEFSETSFRHWGFSETRRHEKRAGVVDPGSSFYRFF